MAQKKSARSYPRYDLHVHSVRTRLPDIDGISVKAALDGIVRDERTIFADDSAEIIREVRFSQEKGTEETTTLTFTEIDDDE